MSKLCKILHTGSLIVPEKWVPNVTSGINRLYYIHGGEGGYIKNGNLIPFKTGKLYLIPGSANIYTYAPSHDGRLVHSFANFELIPPIISAEVLSIDPFSDPICQATLEIFCTLSKKCTDDGEICEHERELLSSSVLYLSERIALESNAEILDDQTILKALQIMHSDYAKKISISDIADMCYMSTDGFIRKFYRALGQTPYVYLKKLRLRHAVAMRKSGATLEEAAESCGYADASSLLHATKNNGR